jgi:hypothetical protein
VVPLLAVLPRRGYVPDFLTSPPQTARPFLRRQLAQIRATEPVQVAPPSMAARRRDRRGTVAADANELCPTPVSVSALLITGLSF